jgi:hypothetical protein
MRENFVALVLVGILTATVYAAGPNAPSNQALDGAIKTLAGAKWITSPAAAEEGAAVPGRLHFRHTFVVPYESKDRIGCALWVAAKGSRVRMFLNGFFLAEGSSPDAKVYLFDRLPYLNPGRNSLALEVDAQRTGPPAMAVAMRISQQSVESGAHWRVSARESAGWRTPFFDDEAWPKAVEFAGATPTPVELVQLPKPRMWPLDEWRFFKNQPYTDVQVRLWPAGPKTLPLTGEQAQALLEADWLFQASGKATPENRYWPDNDYHSPKSGPPDVVANLVRWTASEGGSLNIAEITPKYWGSPSSPLANLILSGHRGKDGKPRVEINAADRRTIMLWMDRNVPYYGSLTENK